MEKYKESLTVMGVAFRQNVPVFRDINMTMLSVTPETLVKLLYKKVEVYEKILKSNMWTYNHCLVS